MSINTKKGLALASIVALYSAALGPPSAVACETLEELEWEYADADAHRLALESRLEVVDEELATVRKEIAVLGRKLRDAIRASDNGPRKRSSITEIERSLASAYEELGSLVVQQIVLDENLNLTLDGLEDLIARIQEAETRADVEQDGFTLCPCHSGWDICGGWPLPVLYCVTDGETQTEHFFLWGGCPPCGGEAIGYYVGMCE
jgi:hypothetical protein